MAKRKKVNFLPWLYFLRAQDFEARLKFAKTHHFSRTILYSLLRGEVSIFKGRSLPQRDFYLVSQVLDVNGDSTPAKTIKRVSISLTSKAQN